MTAAGDDRGGVTDKHRITVEEALQDIEDTEREIAQMDRELEAFEMLGDKMSRFKADHRRTGIRERREFITEVRAMLDNGDFK